MYMLSDYALQVAMLRKTMEFVEQYLGMHPVWSFEDKEQNLLTFEVRMLDYTHTCTLYVHVQ